MRVHILSVGNELLIGDTVNTNASRMGRWLTQAGLTCARVVTVGDEYDALTDALDAAFRQADAVLLTGGLGPTHDDITKSVLCGYFGVELVRHEPTLVAVRRMFERRGLAFPPSNFAQADLPANAEVLPNPLGTAPGLWFEHQGKPLAVMPGVPREMAHLMEHEVMPRLVARAGGRAYRDRYYQVVGIGESTLSDWVIGPVDDLLQPGLTMAFLPHTEGITLRISSVADTPARAEAALQPLATRISTKAAAYIFASDAHTRLETAVVALLTEAGRTLATAESCTGGWISNLVTNVPGSSAVFLGGVAAYANAAKTDLLDVPADLIAAHGAVSKEVAIAMAAGAARRFGADYALSTTGIAGPGGGSADKPVGLVWIGFHGPLGTFAVEARFFKERLVNKEKAALTALDILRRQVLGIPGMPYDLQPEYP